MGQSVSVAEAVDVRIASRTSDVVTIHVKGRMHAGATDYWDGNWLLTPIERQLGAFTGRVRPGSGSTS